MNINIDCECQQSVSYLPDNVTMSNNERFPKLKLWIICDTPNLEDGKPRVSSSLDTIPSMRPFKTFHLGPPDYKYMPNPYYM